MIQKSNLCSSGGFFTCAISTPFSFKICGDWPGDLSSESVFSFHWPNFPSNFVTISSKGRSLVSGSQAPKKNIAKLHAAKMINLIQNQDFGGKKNSRIEIPTKSRAENSNFDVSKRDSRGIRRFYFENEFWISE